MRAGQLVTAPLSDMALKKGRGARGRQMKAHYVIPVIILVGIVGSVIGWSAAQIVTGPDWPAVLATATFLLAMATMWIAWESRTSRREAAQRDREVAFRAALVELATNIQGVEAWDPSLESTPPEKWLQTPLAFAAAKSLLAHVWVPAALWDRITTLVTNLAAYVEVVTAQIRGLPPDASTRGEYTAQRQNIMNLRYLIDIYLKQLACYLFAEMQRQWLDVPSDWKDRRPLFDLPAWDYGPEFKSAADAAQSVDRGPMWPPFTAQAPEPDDPAYCDCTLERLIERARQKADAKEAAIREIYAGGTPATTGEA